MTADVVVVVPVLGRPDHAARFMESFRANTPEGRAVVLAVLSPDDPVPEPLWMATMRAWVESGAHVDFLGNKGTTFAAKVNYAHGFLRKPFGEIKDPSWLLLVGSDVVFHPGWLEQVLMTAELSGAKLIATNDLGNAKVMSGEHATHPLINRAWIDEHGASWDGPGVLAHEGYRHCFVDNEWTMVARDAGVFAFAQNSMIEHLHPAWGKAADDATYRLGEAAMRADHDHFIARVLKYTGPPEQRMGNYQGDAFFP